MKKILLGILMLLTVSTSAYAEGAYLKIQPACMNSNNEVEVQVLVSESGIGAGSFNVIYDNEALTPKSIQKGEILNGCSTTYNLNYGVNTVRANWSKTQGSINGGVVYTLTFDVISGAKEISEITLDRVTLVSSSDFSSMDCTITPANAYLNGVFADTAFVDNTDTLDVTSTIYNASGNSASTDVYIAQYKADGTLLSIEKHNYSQGIASISSDTNTLTPKGDTSYIRVYSWESGSLKAVSNDAYFKN